MTFSAGTFGGYKGRAIDWRPDRNGLLTFVAQGRPSALELLWSFGASGTFSLGKVVCPGAPAAEPTARIRGWVTFEQSEPGARALVSRAWPAARVHHGGCDLLFHTSGAKLLGVLNGQPGLIDTSGPTHLLSEPWIVIFGHEGAEDAPMLLTFTRRVTAIARTARGYKISLDAPGAVQVMPLEGIRRSTGDAGRFERIDHWVASARAWVGPLLAFPVECTETAVLSGDRVSIEARFGHEVLSDAYGNQAEALAPLPPVVAQAALAGYPVELPEGLEQDSLQLGIPTLYGPFQFVRGDRYGYSLPLPVGSAELPLPARSREPWSQPIREELGRIVEGLGAPGADYVDNNLRVVAFLADALPELDDAAGARARAYAEASLEGALGALHETTEPLTGQTWWTVAKTWRSHFSASDPPWAKDQERFDSEFYNGQALSALEAAARLDPGLARRYGEQARRLYTYYQLFWDWATGSALTHATGEGANIDGVQFAWEGMLATARLARLAGDAALAADALYRAARQEVALYAMWQHAAWVKRWGYAIGHVSKGRLASADVETVGPIDAFVEEYGASVLELRSFWQCTNFLFYANRPLFELYRRHGLLERIRVIEYEIMPRLHPRWQDGNAVDPHGENGQERYGTAWTAAHLAARAALFGDDASALFQVYERTKGTPAAETWYRMQAPPIAGPLMLSLLEGGAPAAPLIA